MYHVQRDDGVKRRCLLYAPCCCAHVDIERCEDIAQPCKFDPTCGAGASVGIRIAWQPCEAGHRSRKMHGMLASPATDLQHHAMCGKNPFQDGKDRCRIARGRRRKHSLVRAHAALFKRNRRAIVVLLGHGAKIPWDDVARL